MTTVPKERLISKVWVRLIVVAIFYFCILGIAGSWLIFHYVYDIAATYYSMGIFSLPVALIIIFLFDRWVTKKAWFKGKPARLVLVQLILCCPLYYILTNVIVGVLMPLGLEQQEQALTPVVVASGKDQIAEIRERYENFDPDILSKADAEEIIAIDQQQDRDYLEYQQKIIAWNKLDPVSRGPQPEFKPQANHVNIRRQKLQAKVQVAHEVKREIDRLEKLSKTHNIPILDNERTELIELYREKQTFQADMNEALMKALISEDGQFNAAAIKDGQVSVEVINKLPRDLLISISEIEQRIETIQAPFKAAETADTIREDMTKLSAASGVAISSDDIAETIELNAEKDRILKRTQLEARKKWIAEGGPISAVQNSLPNAEDGARLKEIEARLKEISAPITEVK